MNGQSHKSARIFFLYLVLSIVLTWPMAINFYRYPLFDRLDIGMTILNFWWQYYALFHFHADPWFHSLVNYPDGFNLVFFPLYLAYGVLSFPFQFLFGSPDAIPGFFNWISILSFVFTGFLAFLICKKIVNSAASAFIAGILFAFLPFHYWHLPRCHASCLELVLLPIYCYLRLLENKTRKTGIVFGLSLVPLFYQSPNYLVYVFLFFGLHLIYLLAADRKMLDRKWLGSVALAALIAITLALPFLLEAGKEIIRQTTPATNTVDTQILFSANPVGMVLPGPNQKLYGPLGRLGESLIAGHGLTGKEIFPGYLLLVTGVFGIFLARRRVKFFGFWVLVFLFFLIMSLGPFLDLAGKTFYSFPLPFYLLQKIFPLFVMDRSPGRMTVLAYFALAVFSAAGFAWIGGRLKSGKRTAVFAALGAFALLELNQAPIKMGRIRLPQLYQEIAQEPGEFSVLDLPLLPDIYRFSGYFQVFHKKGIVAAPRKGEVTSEDQPLFYYFDEPGRMFLLPETRQVAERARLRAELKRRRVKYAVVYLRFVDAEKRGHMDQLLERLGPVKVFNSENLFSVYQFAY